MKPNVILFNCDDMGYGDLGCYGSTVNFTPFIDSLAQEGVKFDSFYACSPVCSPSRAGLMTGCYPPRVGITRVLFPGQKEGLGKNEYTLGNMFKDNGYKTMAVGKWHCGDQKECLPTNFGFDDYYGLPYSNDMGIQHRTDPAKSNRVYPPLPLVSGDEVIQQQPDQTALTERYVEKAIDFIRKSKEDPFFLYFAHMHVHLPLYAAEQFYKNSINGDFGACMASVDWSVHAITDELKRLGKYEDTILIFTSDNGSRADHGASNHPLKGKKATVWEGGMRVPCIVHWKGHIKEGVRINSIASNIDLLPTLAAITGGKLSDNQIDGMDVSALFYGEDRAVRTQMIYYRNTILSAVRKDQMKLHLNRDGEAVCELYDLENDISEENDIASQNPEIVEELSKLAEEYRYKLGDSFYHISGTENRDCNITENAVALTAYDENHPYIIAMYDKPDCG